MSTSRAATHILTLGALALANQACRAQCTPQWLPIGNSDAFFAPATAVAAWDIDGPGPTPPRLVIAGNFVQVGSTSVQHIVAWDGASWSPLGAGIAGGNIRALIDFNGLLIAAGQFGIAGTIPANNIAAFNGSTWSPFGTGLPGGEVRALAVVGNALYAGGQFFVTGGSHVAQWNGSIWVGVGGGVDTTVRALVPYSGGIVAGGFFNSAGGNFAPRAAWWNGTQWSALGSGPASPVTSLAVYQGRIVAGQFSSISEFNGSTWQPMGAGLSGEVDALTIYNGDLIAAGTFGGSGPTFLNRIGRWNGSTWSPLGTGVLGFPVGATTFRSELILAGAAATSGGPPYWARWTDSAMPWIAAQPVAPANQPCPASNLTLTVTAATGYGSLSYQWRKNTVPLADGLTGFGSSISGAMTPSLSITAIAPVDAGAYDCIVTGTCTAVTSDPVVIAVCTANCDCSTASPSLNVNDFTCFLNKFAAGDPYANCDASTSPPLLNVNDFTCFLNRFAAGCP